MQKLGIATDEFSQMRSTSTTGKFGYGAFKRRRSE
jgi:hypothetical protein